MVPPSDVTPRWQSVGVETWQEKRRADERSNRVGGRSAGELTSVRFAQLAGQLNQVAAAHGLRAVDFRSPPRQPGLSRSIARRRDGSATVAVALRGRPSAAVAADMIDGVVAASGADPGQSAEVRDHLWSVAAAYVSTAGAHSVEVQPVEVQPVDMASRPAALGFAQARGDRSEDEAARRAA